jgi:hypothetical protein
MHEPMGNGGCSKGGNGGCSKGCFFLTWGKRKMHEEKEEFLLFSSIILATDFLHLPSSYNSFSHFAKQYLEPPIPTGPPSTLAAVLPSFPASCTVFLHLIYSCTMKMLVRDSSKTHVAIYQST